MAYRDDHISGMRGWLLLFFLTLAAFQPLFLIFRILVSLGEGADLFSQSGWPLYVTALRILTATIVAASWLLAVRLWFFRNWRTIRIVIAGIWAINLGAGLFDLMATIAILGVEPGHALGSSLSGLVRGTLYCTVWTAYLLRSRRVANTYRRDSDDEKLAAVFD